MARFCPPHGQGSKGPHTPHTESFVSVQHSSESSGLCDDLSAPAVATSACRRAVPRGHGPVCLQPCLLGWGLWDDRACGAGEGTEGSFHRTGRSAHHTPCEKQRVGWRGDKAAGIPPGSTKPLSTKALPRPVFSTLAGSCAPSPSPVLRSGPLAPRQWRRCQGLRLGSPACPREAPPPYEEDMLGPLISHGLAGGCLGQAGSGILMRWGRHRPPRHTAWSAEARPPASATGSTSSPLSTVLGSRSGKPTLLGALPAVLGFMLLVCKKFQPHPFLWQGYL